MENKLEQEKILQNKEENNLILPNTTKTELDKKDEEKININNNTKEKELNDNINDENRNNQIDKNQILQDKLKKIFIERETNKFKYNIVKIPDNLKYSSDNSNSSTPKRPNNKNNVQDIKDVNKIENKTSDENNINNNNDIIVKRSDYSATKSNEEKNIISEKETKKENNKLKEEISENIINKEKFSDKNLANDEKNKSTDHNINETEKNTNNILTEDETNTNTNNNINVKKNNNMEKDSTDNLTNNQNYSFNNNNIEKEIKNNDNDNKNNTMLNSNKDNDNDIINNSVCGYSNNVGRSQVCKNYVIKRIVPERRKNKNITLNNNEEELRNRTFSLGFDNYRKKNNIKNNKEEDNNILSKTIDNKEKEKEKEINDNNDISNNNNIVNNENKEEEDEEEKNKRLYRLLMAKKLNDQNIQKNSNHIFNSVNFENSEKSNKIQSLRISNNLTNKENLDFLEEKRADINNSFSKKKENKKEVPTSSEMKNKKKRSRTMIKSNDLKESNSKEGVLKLLELIKAKKNEKNAIEQIKKETQDIIQNAKSQPVDVIEAKKEEENNNNNKNIETQSTNKNIQEIKEKQKIDEKEEKDNKENKEEQNKNDKLNLTKEIPKKIYRRYKGKHNISNNNNNTNINTNNNNVDNRNTTNIRHDNNNITNKDFIENEFKKDIIKKKENNNFNKSISSFDLSSNNNINNGYKTDIESYNKTKKIFIKGKTNNNLIRDIRDNNNNILLSNEEKMRREKLEKDISAEINKNEISTGGEFRENNIMNNKYSFNRNNTTLNINSQFYISNQNPKIHIKNSCNSIKFVKNNNNNNNVSQNQVNQNQDNTNYIKTNNNLNINKEMQYNNHFYGDMAQKKYEQIKTFNPKNNFDSSSKMKNNANNDNINKILNINNENKLVYAPKKCNMISKEKTKSRITSLSPFAPKAAISSNVSDTKNLSVVKNVNEKTNNVNKSPQAFNINKDEKVTYVKKNLSNIISNKNDNINKLNNSLGQIGFPNNNNFDINRIIKNKKNTEIDSLELNPNLNSSFKLRKNIEKNKYSKGNIFNQDSNDYNNNNNFNANENLNYSYNHRFYNPNSSRHMNHNNSMLGDGYNSFYKSNKLTVNRNNLHKSTNNYNIFDKFDNDINYETSYSNNNQNKNNPPMSIYSYNSSYRKRHENDDGYNSINILNNINNININNNINSYNIDYQMKYYDFLKYEDLLILEDKLITIMFSLNDEKIIYNECFEYWNYFFNCSFYENINKLFSNCDLEYKNLLKISVNYILMSIMLSYDMSFEKVKLDKIRPLLLEMLELCHKLLISIYEFILNSTKNNFNSNNGNDMWIKKLNHLINSSKLSDGSDSLFIDSTKMTEKDKKKYNTNFLMQKLYFILYNYPSNHSQNYLMSLLKKINNKSYEDINDFFLEYILHEKDVKYSVLATTFLKSGEILAPKPLPYLNYKSTKKYSLVLDIDETLFHFKINEEDEEQGVLKIRPGVFQFIDKIKDFYEIILFSEAEQNYIELITEAVVENKYFYDCILCRDYVTIVGQNFVKELSKIGRPLDKLIIIDNMPQNFSFNKENSIYIKSFWGEENDDKALIDLIPILVNIAKSGNDVRKELVKYKEKIVTKISSNLYKHNNM